MNQADTTATLLFDAHLDLAWNALSFDRDLTDSIDQINARERLLTDSPSRGNATVSFSEMRRGNVAVCLGTMIAHARPDLLSAEAQQRTSLEYRSPEAASAIAQGQLAYYRLLERAGQLRLLSTASELTSHWDCWTSSFADGKDHALPIGLILASHNNCRALVPGQRQFTDQQLQLLIERGAVIGVAMDNWMLVADWQTGVSLRSQATLDHVANHIDHICQLAGSHRHVAIGSDLDGGYGAEQSPADLDTIADLQKIGERLQQRGYEPETIRDIFHGNWLRFFKTHLPDS